MKLKDYLLSQRLSVADFAKRVECHYNQMFRAMTGMTKPSLYLLAKITAGSRGMVTAEDFLTEKEKATCELLWEGDAMTVDEFITKHPNDYIIIERKGHSGDTFIIHVAPGQRSNQWVEAFKKLKIKAIVPGDRSYHLYLFERDEAETDPVEIKPVSGISMEPLIPRDPDGYIL